MIAQDDDVLVRLERQGDLRRRPGAHAARDHQIARQDVDGVARVPHSGDDGDVDRFRRAARSVPGEDADRQPARLLRSPAHGVHHAGAPPAAQDDPALLRQQRPESPSVLQVPLAGAGSRPHDADNRAPHARFRSTLAGAIARYTSPLPPAPRRERKAIKPSRRASARIFSSSRRYESQPGSTAGGRRGSFTGAEGSAHPCTL